MPYRRDPKHLSLLIQRAADSAEIKEWVKKARVDPETLKSKVAANAARAWEAGAEPIAEFNTTERWAERIRKEAANEAPPPSLWLATLRGLRDWTPLVLAQLLSLILRPLDLMYEQRRARFVAGYEARAGLPELKKKLEAANKAADDAVVTAGILPMMRVIINETMLKG